MSRRDFNAACPHFEVLEALRPRDYAATFSLALVLGAEARLQDRRHQERAWLRVAGFAAHAHSTRDDPVLRGPAHESARRGASRSHAGAERRFRRGTSRRRCRSRRATPRARAISTSRWSRRAATWRSKGTTDSPTSRATPATSNRLAPSWRRPGTGRSRVAISPSRRVPRPASLSWRRRREDRATSRTLMATLDTALPDPWLLYRIGRAWARAGREERGARRDSFDRLSAHRTVVAIRCADLVAARRDRAVVSADRLGDCGRRSSHSVRAVHGRLRNARQGCTRGEALRPGDCGVRPGRSPAAGALRVVRHPGLLSGQSRRRTSLDV